jgi:hypothetical protein
MLDYGPVQVVKARLDVTAGPWKKSKFPLLAQKTREKWGHPASPDAVRAAKVSRRYTPLITLVIFTFSRQWSEARK